MRHVWWKGKVTHPPSVGEKLYMSEQQIQFSPALYRQHIYYLVSMRLKYRYEFMGWDGLFLLNILHNNQLKELGDLSNNAIVNLPVHVFQELIFLKEVN